MTRETDVLIVGWGPVGQTLAILLAGHGWRVTALEKQPAPYPLPRAVHFDHETARILQAAGVADAMADGRIETADVYEWRNGKGDVLLRFTSKSMGMCGWPKANMFAQPELERLLDEKARSLPGVTLLRGHEVSAVLERDGGVLVTARTAGAADAKFRAKFVVGCDGANSFVRSSIDAPVTDLGFFYDWLIVDVRPHVPKLWSPLNIQICDPARPTTLVSGGPGRRRWEFMRLPGEAIEDLNREETAWRLLAPWDVHPGNADLERHTVYRFQARWVELWRKGRVLLAGDAAHQTPPFAGQGMCAGLRDAMNLAWKLDLVLGGRAPDSLLDAYAEERMSHVRMMIEFALALEKVICVPDHAEAEARDASMMATRDPQATPPLPGIVAGVLHEGDPLAGRVCVQGQVRADGREGLFDDVVGRGWTLLLSREIWKYGGALLQAEDEIAGIGAALGASFAGRKSMTATSGPGMSLKTEILGLASIAELPLVLVSVQRGGPSTGCSRRGSSIPSRRRRRRASSTACAPGWSSSSRTRGSCSACCACSSTCHAGSRRSRAAGRIRSCRARWSSGCAQPCRPRPTRDAREGGPVEAATHASPTHDPREYKSDLKPIWCPGCGDYGVLTALYRALADVGRPPHEIALVSGISCSSRIPGYTTAYGFNSVHGRAADRAGHQAREPEPRLAGAGQVLRPHGRQRGEARRAARRASAEALRRRAVCRDARDAVGRRSARLRRGTSLHERARGDAGGAALRGEGALAALPRITDASVKDLFTELCAEDVAHQDLVKAEIAKLPPEAATGDDDFADDPNAQRGHRRRAAMPSLRPS